MTYAGEYQQLRAMGAGRNHRNGFRKRVEREMKPILVDLSTASSQGDAAAAYLYAAGKECLLPMMQSDSISRSDLERSFAENMSRAAKHIENVDPPEEPTVKRTFSNPIGVRDVSARTSERTTPRSKQ